MESLLNIETLQTFLGWSLLTHAVVMLLAATVSTGFLGLMVKVHHNKFTWSKEQSMRVSFNYLAAHKVFFIIFVLMSYVVIRFLM